MYTEEVLDLRINFLHTIHLKEEARRSKKKKKDDADDFFAR